MSHDRGCSCGREKWEYAECRMTGCLKKDRGEPVAFDNSTRYVDRVVPLVASLGSLVSLVKHVSDAVMLETNVDPTLVTAFVTKVLTKLDAMPRWHEGQPPTSFLEGTQILVTEDGDPAIAELEDGEWVHLPGGWAVTATRWRLIS